MLYLFIIAALAIGSIRSLLPGISVRQGGDQLAINDIRRHLYDHVLHMPLNFFEHSGTSDVTSRLVQDSAGASGRIQDVLGQRSRSRSRRLFALALALMLSWKLTLFIVLFAPLMAAVIKKFGKKMRRASRAAMQRFSDMLGQIEGTLIGIRVVKAATAPNGSSAAAIERFSKRCAMSS